MTGHPLRELPVRTAVALIALLPAPLAGQTPPAAAPNNPWTDAIQGIAAAMTGPIARGLSLIAIVVGGLMFAFGEGGSKRALAGIIFGLGLAMGAAGFLDAFFDFTP